MGEKPSVNASAPAAISTGLLIGGEWCCQAGSPELAVIHSCKHPCHKAAVGYSLHPPKDHPLRLVKRDAHDLYLNLIDPPVPLFPLELFEAAFAFAHDHGIHGRTVLIHCNKGESRAPSLGLLLLARRGALPIESYAAATAAFREQFYPGYKPGAGLVTFLTQQWDTLIRL